ncbi:MAG TPA: gluconate 2-dehydrogenase subunit 3 family protein [Acetobacteraceae bacterium]|nr:gluconate 2-dehydrogenase subunit 3 family protein [Acetobacteraceae bacterium]
MRQVDGRTRVSRRVFLRNGATAVPAAAVAAAGMTISPEAGWAQDAKTLSPHTMATLARMARDIYPHDRLADVYYIKAVAGYDAKAGQDAAFRKMVESGIAQLDASAQQRHKSPYLVVAWESDRVVLLQGASQGALFKKLQGDLLVSLYNNKEVWPKFGYEGSSADKGGYINRGFSDIDWLAQA